MAGDLLNGAETIFFSDFIVVYNFNFKGRVKIIDSKI